ncbi:undecaprenyl-phosphate glucose phosphotransferase [Desulfovibrio gilichinskyi]|uniref:Putative colanic acid biosysnthesis UDP-glucose lipid carrier transferase n=1 Tax=Desulfovibrio gilichinskyi TaxID=1519643 RepID=A0A1X7C6C4_9BACT|nr:undecaprenyl-phosphate glucose phosphotransferase [Desulfovibrio gilichinskyi]SME90627.1 putative colanic acid biosysnthesis UDP-glucose lipid carrier transferase [Desulfovibrio gilichinskyi]
MNRKFRVPAGMLKPVHRILDAAFGVGVLLVLYFYFWPQPFAGKSPQIALLIVTTTVLILSNFQMVGVYKDWASSDIVSECNRIILGVFFVFATMLMLGYFFKVSSLYSRRVILLWLFIWPAVICSERFLVKKIFFKWLLDNGGSTSVVIAGTGKIGASLADWISDNPWAGMRVEGFFDPEDSHCGGSSFCLGSIDELPKYVKNNNIQLVYLALPMREEPLLNKLLHGLEDSTAQVFFFPDMSLFKHLMGGDVARVAGQTAIVLRSSPFAGVSGVLKRSEDLILGFLILLAIFPVMLLIALGLKLTSKGPVFFKQWRYGLEGEPFQIFKFRTMKVLEDGYDFVPATENDARITRFGSFLRKNSLDELPQFLNVLKGNMSVVGPRPHAVKMNEEYRRLVSGYMLRHISKPGITGLAQINGYKGEVHNDEDMKKRISYDIEYLQNWSVFLDLEIIVKTIFKFAWRQ